MDGIYRLLVKATLGAAVILATVSLITAVTLDLASLIPMLALATASGFYARRQMTRSST